MEPRRVGPPRREQLNTFPQPAIGTTGSAPESVIHRLGMITRDYRVRFSNGYRDFSQAMPSVLELLDKKGCDTALFSLFSIIPRQSYDPCAAFQCLRSITTICLEEFQDGPDRIAGRYVVYHRTPVGWKEYTFRQAFGTTTGKPEGEIVNFVRNELPRRIFGNCCVLLCGEANAVKYRRDDKRIHDSFGLRGAIPQHVNVILNPIHDLMTRFEMKFKRQFLSEKNRYVCSVWNKGKQDKRGLIRDGKKPAWTVFRNGNEVYVQGIHSNCGVEIGVVDIR